MNNTPYIMAANNPWMKGYNGTMIIHDKLNLKDYQVSYQYRNLSFVVRVNQAYNVDIITQTKIKNFARKVLKDLYIGINLSECRPTPKNRRRPKQKNIKKYYKKKFTKNKK